MDLPPALYLPREDGSAATALTSGPWDPGLQRVAVLEPRSPAGLASEGRAQEGGTR